MRIFSPQLGLTAWLTKNRWNPPWIKSEAYIAEHKLTSEER